MLKIEEFRDEIGELCQSYGVTHLDLFGSAVSSEFDAKSDVDVLVTFEMESGDFFQRYFGLKESLELLFGRPVDLVTSASIRNPYFRAEVERTKFNVYDRQSQATSV